MATIGANKRIKEKNRHDKQREKAQKRLERSRNKPERGPAEPGVDLDIAGIIPGPQPIPEDS
jgi:hypothetical protein